jgi:hypothetical protein
MHNRPTRCPHFVVGLPIPPTDPGGIEMKERPILFSAPMVRALLDGTKTQTRRIIKPNHCVAPSMRLSMVPGCPYGVPGDRLWVRETFCPQMNATDRTPFYRSTGDELPSCHKWKPSIFMPRWASRITLEITEVRVQRVQDISEEDAKAEGGGFIREHPDADETLSDKKLFQFLWESISGETSWDANPWVWAITFRRIEK